MSRERPIELPWEEERYELEAEAERWALLSRRDLLKTLGGGLLILLCVGGAEAVQESGGRRGGGRPQAPQELSAWLHIGEDGTVSVFTGKTEVGQNIRTSLSQAVAEELRVPLASVRMVMADTALTPYDMGTFGSRTTPAMAPQLRRAAAAAREELVRIAAETWKTEPAALSVAEGRVTHAPTGRSAGFGELTRGQKLVRTVSQEGPLTPAAEWKVAGTSVPKVDARAIVTGLHRYSSDQRRPGMQVGKVLRAPAYGAERLSLDPAAAAAMPGVQVVQDGPFVGVVAPDELTATRALAALKAAWKQPEGAPSSAELWDLLKKGGPPQPDPRVEEALKGADHRLAATYTIAYIAHVPLEPRAAVAEWEGDRVTVWTGTQRPFGVRGELASALGIPEERIRVIVPDTGSGYGGKHTGEAAVEAARLARAAGKPVRVVWSRPEEFTWAYQRPAGVIEVQGGVSRDGTLLAWDFHNYNSGGSGLQSRYEVAARREQSHRAESPLRQGSYRGLAAAANHFARECHLDDLAKLAGLDPLEFRLKNLKDERMRAVLQAAAERFGWDRRRKGENVGAGLAVGFEKGGYVATCAEVEVDRPRRAVRVTRAVTAFECGAIVNPRHLESQVEGCVVMGLGGALFERIDFGEGRVRNAKLAQYRVPRFSDLPPMEIVLLDRKDLPSAGAGETPIVGIAPAIGNAIFAACGQRIRSLPMLPDGLPDPA
ncbi:MAG: molybdopterin cofactor-binding domain-containing protein [Armatimonadota bacterium]